MRAPLIPGKRPDDGVQHDAMLRRLGIAEDRPATPSRWDVLARDLEPTPPVQTPPPLDPVAEAPLPERQPILMTDSPRAAEAHIAETMEMAAPEPVHAEAPQPLQPVEIEAPAPQPEPEVDTASFMPGWGEESIPEDEASEAEAFDEPEAPAEAAFESPDQPDEAPAEPAAVDPEPAATAEVIFIEQVVGAATAQAVEAPVDDDRGVTSQEAEEELPDEPGVEALEQVRGDLEAIRRYMEAAPASEIVSATPVVVAILQLAAGILDRPRPD